MLGTASSIKLYMLIKFFIDLVQFENNMKIQILKAIKDEI